MSNRNRSLADDVTEEEAWHAVQTLIRYVGEDPSREGLRDTPRRVVGAWDELTQGYQQDPAEILGVNFDGKGYDQVIVCPSIDFYSTCEHHLLPFFGVAHVGYLPRETKSKVVGLSKMARLVDCFARRFQIQENLTMQIADAMQKHLTPRGVAVVIQAKHLCMACRGVMKHRPSMVTSAMRGVFRKEGPARSEFFRMVELSK